MSRRKKQARPQFSKYRFQNESAWAHSLWPHADSIWSRYFEICGRACFFLRLIILLTDPILSHSPNFGRPKQGQKFVVPTFHIHFLNPECVRIPWVLAPKNFHVQNFRVRSDLQKSSIFHWFLLPPPKKKYRARVPTILMPPTFPIARLNRYTPNFSGVPQKLTWCQQFGLQIFPKWGDAEKPPQKNPFFRCFFWQNKFSRPNGRLLPIACHTYLESYGT